VADIPVVTTYPHDRLSRLADAMVKVLEQEPGAGDVRAVVMLNDADSGCVHPHGYPDPEGRRNALLFIDTAVHLGEMGRALGVKTEILVNGRKVPSPGPEVPRG
jgi:hypothetical protein